jgi:hypothetical protein
LRAALLWDITQRIVAIPYQHFGTTYRSYTKKKALNTRAIDCPETSVRNCRYTLSNIPEEPEVTRPLPRSQQPVSCPLSCARKPSLLSDTSASVSSSVWDDVSHQYR